MNRYVGNRYAAMTLGCLMSLSAIVVQAADAPNLYELWARHLKVTYSTSSLAGVPILHYEDGDTKMNFKGDDIRIVATELGQQVSVTLEQVPDLKAVTFTMLIPDINLIGQTVPFRTVGITTTHRTSIGGPALVKGPLQLYSGRTLRGQASRVAFLGDEATGVKGEVVSRPCPGPVRPGPDCSVPFAGATVQLLNKSADVVGTAVTNDLGSFFIRAKLGTYLVHVATGGVFPHCSDSKVEVTKSDAAFVSVSCESGMR